MKRRTLYDAIRHEVDCLRFEIDHGDYIEDDLDVRDLKATGYTPLEIFEMVSDRLAENDEIGQAMAHAKVSARIPTSFCVNGSHFYNETDVLMFDIMLMDVLGFTERETMEVISGKLESWIRYVKRRSDTMNDKLKEVMV